MRSGKDQGARKRVIWLVAVLIILAVVGLGGYNFTALPGCESCHDRESFTTATSEAAHASVDCRSCHVPAAVADRLAFSLRQPLHMFVPFPGGADRDAAAVPDERCIACHQDLNTRVSSSGGIRMPHASCALGASCSDCHSATAHGAATAWVRAYDMDRCLGCHVEESRTACDLCHEGQRPSARVASRTFAATHGSEWRTTHGMGNPETCLVCHQQEDCAECHGAGLPHGPDFIQTHFTYAAEASAKCGGCHESSFCDGCHGMEMPHPAGFVEGHAGAAEGQPDACKRCHVEADCTTCHVKHVHPGGASGATTGGGS